MVHLRRRGQHRRAPRRHRRPGGICLSASAHEQVRGKIDVEFADLGDQEPKNIARPIRAYRIVLETPPPPEPAALPLPDKPSIAVLPFQNMSGDPEQEYFADGMVEEIITALSRIRWLFVIARNSSFTYKGQSPDVKQVGRELGVRYVLEGSVRKGGNRVRITAQLIDAETGTHLWADRFDGLIEDVFELQDKVASASPGSSSRHADRRDRAIGRPSDGRPYRLRSIAARPCDDLVVGNANPRSAPSPRTGDRARPALRARPRLGRGLL